MAIRPAIFQQLASVKASLLMLVGLCVCLSGCNNILYPINAIPAPLVPPEFLAEPQSTKRPIDLSLLRHVKPPHYILDADDILGVYIEGVLGEEASPPPVQPPPPGSDLPPALGFPIVVREDGTISLPLLDPMSVKGMTVGQVEELIKKTYEEKEILVEPNVIVTIMQKRTYRVFVIRQDNLDTSPQIGLAQLRQGVVDRSDFSSRGYVLSMPAYENDLLNALSQTGGLPGLNSKPEVRILRGANIHSEERFEQLRQIYDIYPTEPNTPTLPAPEGANGIEQMAFIQDPNSPVFDPTYQQDRSTVVIPMRLGPNEQSNFRPEDVILRDGDIVFVDSRETDVYYTGGELGGGERLLPRDYDLDVLGAVAISGVGVDRNFGGFLNNTVNTAPPTDLIILRKLPGHRQIAIRVDLLSAINDPRQRLLIAPGDTLLLRFKPEEEALNFAYGVFFTFGLRELFRN